MLVASCRFFGIEAAHLVTKRMAEVLEHDPRRIVECVRTMIELDKEGWTVLGWRDEARTILGTALTKRDSTVREAALSVVHLLGAKGLKEFRDLTSIQPA